MKKIYQKTTYTSPEVETLVVRGEGMICTSLEYGGSGEAGGEIGTGNEYNL